VLLMLRSQPALQRWPPAVLSWGLEIVGHISLAATALAAAVLE